MVKDVLEEEENLLIIKRIFFFFFAYFLPTPFLLFSVSVERKEQALKFQSKESQSAGIIECLKRSRGQVHLCSRRWMDPIVNGGEAVSQVVDIREEWIGEGERAFREEASVPSSSSSSSSSYFILLDRFVRLVFEIEVFPWKTRVLVTGPTRNYRRVARNRWHINCKVAKCLSANRLSSFTFIILF